MNATTFPAALTMRGVSHWFGVVQALDAVSLDVRQGRFVALLGPNGSGKTTLFSILTRLYASRSGSVTIGGHDLDRHPTRALAQLGVVFQSRTLDMDLTVRQNLAYHAALQGLRPGRAALDGILGKVGLADLVTARVRALSGGQARRVEIARALVHGPKLLLLDEATVGLDLASRRSIIDLVRRLVREGAVSALWATHLFDEIGADDFMYVLDKGRIVAEGLARDIIAASGTPSLEAAFETLTGRSGRRPPATVTVS